MDEKSWKTYNDGQILTPERGYKMTLYDKERT